MATYIMKRKFYASESSMENAGDVVGGNIGQAVGAGGGALVGGIGAGLVGAGVGAGVGAKQVINARNDYKAAQDALSKAREATKTAQAAGTTSTMTTAANARTAAGEAVAKARKSIPMANKSIAGNAFKKAGKIGGLAAIGGIVAGGLLGSSMGKSTGQAVGAAAGNVTGGTIDAVNNRIAGNQQRQYAVSQTAKSVWGAVKGLVPKSKRMKAARGVVKADKTVQNTAYKVATNPGSVAKEVVETVGKNPLSVAPGYTGSTAVLTAVKKGKLTTPDSVLKKTIIGKPIYAATEYTGRKLGKLAEPIVNSAYQMAQVM